MAVDEYGRDPEIDYSFQTWMIDGVTYTDQADAESAQSEAAEAEG